MLAVDRGFKSANTDKTSLRYTEGHDQILALFCNCHTSNIGECRQNSFSTHVEGFYTDFPENFLPEAETWHRKQLKFGKVVSS